MSAVSVIRNQISYCVLAATTIGLLGRRLAGAGATVGVAMLLATPCPASEPSNKPADVRGIDARRGDRLMVRLLADADLADFINTFETSHATSGVTLNLVDSIGSRQTYLLELGPPGLDDDDLDALEKDLQTNPTYGDLLAWSDFLYEGQAPEGKTGSFWFFLTDGKDLFPTQYVWEMFNLGVAHQRSTGRGTVVAVLDTGVDASHPLLQGHVLSNGFNFIDGNDDTSDIGDDRDTDGDGFVDEMVGHGTFMASLISLVAPDARILPVRVLNGDGVGNHWLIAKGFYYAIDHGAEVINLSLGSTHNSEVIEDAIEEARQRGIVAVGAGGNLNRERPREFPALLSHAFGVAATDDQDIKAEFSNFHYELTISAPGASAPLAGRPDQYDPERSIIGAIPGGGCAISAGTSLSAAFVSGTAALIRAQYPQWPANQTTHAAIEAAIKDTAVNIDGLNPAFEGKLGAGRLDIAAAVALGPPMPTPGDLDNDGSIDVRDLSALLVAWNQVHSSADLDADGVVGKPDLLILLANGNGGIPPSLERKRGVRCTRADVNDDGKVDQIDLLGLVAAWGPCGAAPDACSADVDGNGGVNVLDVTEAMASWGPCPYIRGRPGAVRPGWGD